jgi:hypothetical protein
LRRASASVCSTAAIDAKSRWRVSSSYPFPEPTFSGPGETDEAADADDAAAAEESLTAGEARAPGRTAADAPDPVGKVRTLGDTVEALEKRKRRPEERLAR